MERLRFLVYFHSLLWKTYPQKVEETYLLATLVPEEWPHYAASASGLRAYVCTRSKLFAEKRIMGIVVSDITAA